jgi:hypothetical protein
MFGTLQSQGWNVTVTSYEIPVNAENQAKSRNISENISIDRAPRASGVVSVLWVVCGVCSNYVSYLVWHLNRSCAHAGLPICALARLHLPSGVLAHNHQVPMPRWLRPQSGLSYVRLRCQNAYGARD